MERFLVGLTRDFERGTLNRRQFCEAVAMAAAVYAAGESLAGAAPAQGFRPLSINHISYACADYRKARDFYMSVLGMQMAPKSDNGREARLMFGPAPGRGGSFLIPRNGRTAANPKVTIDHVCYTIPDWDAAKLRAALAAKGVDATGQGSSLHLYDPNDFDVQLIDAARKPGAAPALKTVGVDHISYTCPNFKATADWYSKFFNLDQTGMTATEVTLAFRKTSEATDTAATKLIIRSANAGAGGDAPKRKSRARVNHIAYTIADFQQDRVRAELKRLGYANPLKDGEHSFHIVDPNGFDVQISGVAMTALQD